MPTFDETRSGIGTQVGAQRDDHDVGVERARIGLDAARRWIDRSDRGLHEAHAGLHQVCVGMGHCIGDRPAEHHVELREAEDEAVRLVDEHDLRVVADRFGQGRRELQPTETGAENQNLH